MPPTNPYIVGAPLQGDAMFFGRDDIFEAVRAHLVGQHQDNPVVIYGQRRTGKTSVLYQMGDRLNAHAGEERYVAVLIDVQGLTLNGMPTFLWSLARTIQRALSRDYHLPVPRPNRKAFETDPQGAFRDTFLPTVCDILGDRRLLLMFDEAARFGEAVRDEHLPPDVFAYLRSLIQHERDLSFIFSLGSQVEQMRQEYALLFNAALMLHVSFLDAASARALILRPVAEWYTFEPEAVEHLLALTSRHPYFTQLLCHALFIRWEREQFTRVTIPDVDAVQDDAVGLAAVNLQYIWNEAALPERCVLSALAELRPEEARLESLYRYLENAGVRFQKADVVRALETLARREVLDAASELGFRVALVRRWLAREKPLAAVREALAQRFSLAAHETTGGDRYRERGQLERARDAYRRALEEAPDYVSALVGLGQVAVEQGEWDKAIATFAQALDIDVGHTRAREGMIKARLARVAKMLEAEQEEAAEAEYRAVLALAPQNTKAQAGLATLEARRREREIAHLRAQAASSLKSGDWAALEENATALLERVPDDDEAKAWLAEAKQQLDLAHWYEQGRAYLEQGEWREAAEIFMRIMNVDLIYREAVDLLAEAVRQLRIASKTLVQDVESKSGVDLRKPMSGDRPPLNAKLGDTWIRPRDGMTMVHVPAGTFWMGSTDAEVREAVEMCVTAGSGRDDCQRWYEREKPRHEVVLEAFWIDQTEVSVGQFRAFVEATGYETEAEKTGKGRVYTESGWVWVEGADWQHPDGPESEAQDTHPVVQVSWDDAGAYCAWVGATLPTEAQREYAARGDDGRIYPWGNEAPTCSLAQFWGCEGRTKPVGSFPDGASWVGALDLAGNVWEWCSDWYGAYGDLRQENPTGPESGKYRVLRGGSWFSNGRDVRSAHRYRLGPSYRCDHVGFRCAVVVSGE